MQEQQRSIGLDVHRDYVMIAGVNSQQQVILEPCKVTLARFPEWSAEHLRSTDQVALEATSNAWIIYDQMTSVVSEVMVANAYKVKLISSSRAKTDRHDAVVLAQLLAANLLPTVWVPPLEVRELRSLVAHRQRLVSDRTTAKNRLHSVLHRHNLQLPAGDPFSEANQTWWQALSLSRAEQLRVRHELAHIQHLSILLAEVEAEIAHLSVEDPWSDQLAFVMQLPGIGLLSGMTILSAIGDIRRFPSASHLVGYSGLASSVHDSGKTHRTGRITKQGRRELRATLVECAWSAVRYAPYWRAIFEQLAHRIGKQKAIVAVARKLLVVIWHVLTNRKPDRQADPQTVARSLMKWASRDRLATSLGLSRPAFVWHELDRLGLGPHMKHFEYAGRRHVRQPA
jgi:transposase